MTNNGESRGFGYVRMDSPENAFRCIRELNGQVVEDHNIIVEIAKNQRALESRSQPESRPPLPRNNQRRTRPPFSQGPAMARRGGAGDRTNRPVQQFRNAPNGNDSFRMRMPRGSSLCFLCFLNANQNVSSIF